MVLSNYLMAERKVKGGKLVRIKVRLQDARLTEVRIEGDFFVHPEEGLAKMEKALSGLSTTDVGMSAERTLADLFAKEAITLIGFGPSDVAELLEEICSRNAGD